MFEDLNTIEYLQITIDKNRITIENVNHHKTFVEKDKVKSTEIVYSDMGDKGFKINFNNNDFLIVTTYDFIFKTQNFGLFKVENLPETASFNDIIENTHKYIVNPEPNNNIDNTTALYLLSKLLLENAEHYNFDVTDLKNKVRKAASETNSIGDITIYD